MSQKRIEIRYYDQFLGRTREPAEAFQIDETSATTRFVATYQFTFRNGVLTLMLDRVVFHFFHPAALLNHLDYIANVMGKGRRSEREIIRLSSLTDEERRAILEVLLRTVIGGGVAGIEGGVMAIDWSSASIKDTLGLKGAPNITLAPVQDRLQLRIKGILESFSRPA